MGSKTNKVTLLNFKRLFVCAQLHFHRRQNRAEVLLFSINKAKGDDITNLY